MLLWILFNKFVLFKTKLFIFGLIFYENDLQINENIIKNVTNCR
jgi:hypothetical protein